MSSPLVIRDAVLFTPTGRLEGDLRVEAGRIAEIGTVSGAGADVVDAGGRWLWPGAIDAHVHFRDPGFPHKEDFESGSAAAVSGGVTTVFDMPNTRPSTITVERLEQKRALIEAKTHCNFGLFFGASPDNLGEALAATQIPGLKIFMGDSTGDLLVHEPEDLERFFASFDGLIAIHGEDELEMRAREALFADGDDPALHSEWRTPELAAMAVKVAADLAIRYGRKLHVLHLSSRRELEVLGEARARAEQQKSKARLTCEACPHHLFWDTDAYAEHGNFARMNPPLRAPEDREATWEALRDGRIDMIATDHAPHTIEEKQRPYREAPSGVPGVETMVPMLLDAAHRGLCTHEQVLGWLCHAPARIYDITDRGRLEVGAHADLQLIDPTMTRTVRNEQMRTRAGWSPWHGRQLTGWTTRTWVGGQLVFERPDEGAGRIVGEGGVGTAVRFG